MSVSGVTINQNIVIKIDWPLIISLICIMAGVLILTIILIYVINYFLWVPKIISDLPYKKL